MYQIYNADCLEKLPELVNEGIQVDSVITDIPYNITSCNWDSSLPLKEIWENLHKICPNGAIVLFAKQPYTSELVMSNRKEYRENIVWLKNKSGNGFSVKQKHMQVLEDIVVFSQQAKYTFNPQKWLISDKEFITQRKTFNEVEVGNNIYGKIKRTRKVDTGERNPLNIVSCRVPFTPQKNRTYNSDVDLRFHPTQKPIELMEYLIKTYTNEGDTVLDFTMGSGTTGVACLKTNREFIGIEKDEGYFNIAKERLKMV